MSDYRILWPNADEMIPKVRDTYVDTENVIEPIMALIDPSSSVGQPLNILLNGPHGLGKSLLAATVAVRLAEKLNKIVPVVTFDCSEDTFEIQLTGSARQVPGGETPFLPGPFPTTIHLANEYGLCVFIVEEISALTPGAQKVFNRLTDWREGIYIPDVNKFFGLKEDCHVVIIANMNPSGYGGVYSLNDDLKSRFFPLDVGFPDTDSENEILTTLCPWADNGLVSQAVQIAQETRSHATEYSLSTRDLRSLLTAYCRLKAANLSPEFALKSVVNKFEGSDKLTIADRVDAVFKTQLKALYAS